MSSTDTSFLEITAPEFEISDQVCFYNEPYVDTEYDEEYEEYAAKVRHVRRIEEMSEYYEEQEWQDEQEEYCQRKKEDYAMSTKYVHD